MMAGRAPEGWPCTCVPPTVQVGEIVGEDVIDYEDVSWHQLGCHIRLNQAALKAIGALFDIETLGPDPRWLKNGINEQQADDLYRFCRWFCELAEQYRKKEAQYGRTWRDAGWTGQVYQVYRRARRLMVLGWWHYDETAFDADDAEQNAGDLATHSYFLVRLLQDGNRKGRP